MPLTDRKIGIFIHSSRATPFQWTIINSIITIKEERVVKFSHQLLSINNLQKASKSWTDGGFVSLVRNSLLKIYLAEYQFCSHLASTTRSTLRMFFPLKGFDMHSTTMALATSADSVGPSNITSSWTWLSEVLIHAKQKNWVL